MFLVNNYKTIKKNKMKAIFKSISKTLIAATMIIGFASNAKAQDDKTLLGAGATFPYPLYSKLFSEYNAKTGIQVNYQSIGSGGGILQLTNKTVDFGASDGPMNADQTTKIGAPVLHIPIVSGAVVITYNLPGDNNGIVLTPDVIADIFLGKITSWSDPRIVSKNKGVKIPALPILVAHRSDGSGTTAIFTSYLSKVSPDWLAKVGQGGAVNWPAGLGGKGNEGVSGLVKQTPGAIGYVELIYALQNKMDYAKVVNKKGKTILPSIASVTAELRDFVFEGVKYEVTSFTLICTGKGFEEGLGVAEVAGYYFNADAQALLKRCQAGSTVVIDEIKVKGPGGSRQLDQNISFTLQ